MYVQILHVLIVDVFVDVVYHSLSNRSWFKHLWPYLSAQQLLSLYLLQQYFRYYSLFIHLHTYMYKAISLSHIFCFIYCRIKFILSSLNAINLSIQFTFSSFFNTQIYIYIEIHADVYAMQSFNFVEIIIHIFNSLIERDKKWTSCIIA